MRVIPRASDAEFSLASGPESPVAAVTRGLGVPVFRGAVTVALVAAAAAALILAGTGNAEAAALYPVQALAPVGSFDQVLSNMRNWLVGILAGLATVFMTVAGVRYILGSGDPGEIERAKVALRAAMIGYGLAVLAPLIVTILRGIVGGP